MNRIYSGSRKLLVLLVEFCVVLLGISITYLAFTSGRYLVSWAGISLIGIGSYLIYEDFVARTGAIGAIEVLPPRKPPAKRY